MDNRSGGAALSKVDLGTDNIPADDVGGSEKMEDKKEITPIEPEIKQEPQIKQEPPDMKQEPLSFAQFQRTPNVVQHVATNNPGVRKRKQSGGYIEAKRNKLSEDIRKAFGRINEADPVILLKQLNPHICLDTTLRTRSLPHWMVITRVNVDGKNFVGTGLTKKAAEVAAAKQILNEHYGIHYNVLPLSSKSNPDVFDFPQSLADKIAKNVNNMFDQVMADNPYYAKYTALAGIVMTKGEKMEDLRVVGLATGANHLSGENMSEIGVSLNDFHAEVLSRRCFKNFLYTQLQLNAVGKDDLSIFERKPDGKFCLKPHHKFHMFVSTVPCGVARMLLPFNHKSKRGRHNYSEFRLLHAKTECGTTSVDSFQWKDTEEGQQRHIILSCSDKIALWNILGIQGSLLSCFVGPIYLHSIVFGRLYKPEHLYTAVCGRVLTTSVKPPFPYRLNKIKIAAPTTLHTPQVTEDIHFSVNWNMGVDPPEIIDTRTGKLFESSEASRLSKLSFFQKFFILSNILKLEVPLPHTYLSVKHSAIEYHVLKEDIRKVFFKAGFGRWNKKPAEQEEFKLVF